MPGKKDDPGVVVNNSPGVRALRTLRDWIAAGRLPAGERLPAETALAGSLGVSRGTARTALRRLEEEGVLHNLDGRGRIVVPGAGPAPGLMAETIAVLTTETGEMDAYRDTGLMRAIEAGASAAIRAAGLHVLVLHPDRLAEAGVDRLLADPPRGVLFSHSAVDSPGSLETLSLLSERGTAVVVYGGGPELERYDRVFSDHAKGAGDLVTWFAERGRRRILRLWTAPRELPWLRMRDSGYEAACRRAGIDSLPAVEVTGLPGRSDEKSGFDARARHFAGFLIEQITGPRPADAVMLVTDADLFPVAAALRLLGKEPGRDVLVAGYDDYWNECWERALEPAVPAVTVDKLNTRAGELMVELLLDRIEGKLPAGPQRVTVEPELRVVEGGRTRAFAARLD